MNNFNLFKKKVVDPQISDLKKKIEDLEHENYMYQISFAALLYNHEYKVGEVVYYSGYTWRDNARWIKFEIHEIDGYLAKSRNGTTMAIGTLKLNDRNVISRYLKDKYPEKLVKMENGIVHEMIGK
jgi:hypothetical protein